MLMGDTDTGNDTQVNDDIFSDFDSEDTTDTGAGMPPAGDDQAPSQSGEEGKTQAGKTVPIESYHAEKAKRQELENKMGEYDAKLSRLDELEKQAKAIEARLPDPNKSEAQLTPEEAKARQIFNEIIAETKKQVGDEFKPELERRDEEISGLKTDIILRDFKEKHRLSDERLDEVLDYAEEHGLKGAKALDASLDAIVGRKYREKRSRTSPSNTEQRELAGKDTGGTTSVGDKSWLRKYNPEEDSKKPLSQIIAEAKEDYARKIESTK